MRITIGRPRGMLSSSGGFPRADPASALIDRMIPTPDATHQTAIRALVESLISAGLWTRFDAFYMFAADSEYNGSINWVSNDYPITKGGSDPTVVTFHVDEGFFVPNSYGYLETGLTPSTAVKFQLNSASFGLWNRFGRAQSTRDAGTQVSDSTTIQLQSGGTGNATLKINNSGVNMSMAVANPMGSFAIGLQTDVHRCEWLSMDGASTLSGFNTGTPTALALDQFRFGGLSSAPRQFACGWIGGGMSLADLAVISGGVRFYLLALGAGGAFVPANAGDMFGNPYFGQRYFGARYFG